MVLELLAFVHESGLVNHDCRHCATIAGVSIPFTARVPNA